MIISPHELEDGTTLSADICIIGGGPAAIAMVGQLSAIGHNIIMIAGGSWTQSARNKDLYRGIVMPKGSHEPLEEMRRRQFGGGSSVWAGRCVPFDSIDFQYRPWVQASGWPVSYQEMLPYFEQASDFCNIGSFRFHAAEVFPDKQAEIIPGFDDASFDSAALERYSPLVHLGKVHRATLEQQTNVKVLLDCHMLALEQTQDKSIDSIRIATGKKRLKVKAKQFVLAAGGIENARLLLASTNQYHPRGIGNKHDNVGRYYMTHITGTYIRINPKNRENILFDFEKDDQEIFCRRRWRLKGVAQEKNGLLNTIFYISHAKSINADRSAIYTVLYNLIRELIRLTGIRQALRKEVKIGNHSKKLALLFKLGMPAILPSVQSKYWGLFFSAEQVPNRNSRIMLSPTKKDAFGMPRIEMHIAFKEIDIESIVLAHTLFAERFKARELGEILFSEAGLRKYLKQKCKAYNSYAHHMGTTRMSGKPEDGVVDKHAKVWGINNLHIAGASTFPTGSHANPTVTVVAQSLRLADRLHDILTSKVSEETVSA